MPIIRNLLLAAAICSPLATAAPNTKPTWTHDPFVVRRSDGRYFRFSTLDLMGIWESSSLAGPWQHTGTVIQGQSVIDMPGRKALWAPDVAKIDDTYYLTYSVSTASKQTSAIGYATSKTLQPGSWTDRGDIGLRSSPSDPYNAIDSNMFRDPSDGTWYLTWGSYWEGIYLSALSVTDDGGVKKLSLKGEKTRLATGKPNSALEGPTMYRHGDYWYLFMSKGRCCRLDEELPKPGEEYHIVVCRSKSVRGPFVGQAGKPCTEGPETVVFKSKGDMYAPGGQGVLNDPELGELVYYHWHNKAIPGGVHYQNATFGYSRLTWGEKGWPIVGDLIRP